MRWTVAEAHGRHPERVAGESTRQTGPEWPKKNSPDTPAVSGSTCCHQHVPRECLCCGDRAKGVLARTSAGWPRFLGPHDAAEEHLHTLDSIHRCGERHTVPPSVCQSCFLCWPPIVGHHTSQGSWSVHAAIVRCLAAICDFSQLIRLCRPLSEHHAFSLHFPAVNTCGTRT